MKRAGLLLALLVRGALELSAASTPVLPPEETPAIPPSAGVALAATSLVVSSGNLELHLARNAGGVQVTSLRDTATGTELQAGSLRLPLFTLVLGNNSQLNADSGWGKVELAAIPGGTSLRWSGAGAVPGLAVVANLLPDSGNSALEWALSVENTSLLPVSRAIFPQFAVADLGSSGRVFLPRGPGEEVLGAWSSAFTYSELYPNGWSASLQVLAAYNGATGLYFAMHDASGATKHIGAYGLPAFKAVKFVFEHLPPGSASSGSSFTLQGRGVWRLLRGDWFDAALVHREWASLQPAMLPPDRAAGSSATPLWMRELGVWTQAAGTDAATIASVQAFARYMGVPTGFHWYTWHAIPFDNDYPHYFPPRAGFAAGVKALQATEPRIRVMPYINGRLWDTRDQGTSDFEYTALAKPATTKDAALAPNTESYGSLEADGSPVKLAVMCPATSLWQSRLRTITLELFKSYGVDGVYLDQIAAAAPKLCYDGGHPHPPGGGRWWVDGYRNLLAGIRNEMPADRMLTSESAVDTFNAGFDGYLVWNWQRNNMVPAFRAIYGGAVQLFGRNYSGGLPRDLSVCQRAGQQLVFGEQLGWAFPGIIYENSAPFLRDCARLRNRLAPYFYAGRMERPPRFTGANPPCTSDWQWQGAATPVTTPSLLTGAFTRPEVQSTILVFANISETTQSGSVSFDGATYDLSGNAVHLRVVRPQATDTAVAQSLAFQKALVLPARSVQAWEIVVAPVEAGAGGGTIPVPADAVPSGNTSNGAGVPAPTPDVGAAPANQAPVVNAGLDLTVTLPSGASLNGSATNDGLPAGNALLYNWNKVSGSGTVTFAAATASATTATFSTSGTYVLRLTAHDGLLSGSDDTLVTVNPDPDGDRDGLPDIWEQAHGLNPLTAEDATQDADNDGLSNLAEYQRGTAMDKADTDGDGLPDGWEVARGLNPSAASDAAQDADADGLTNLQEYTLHADPHNRDSDSDGLPDGFEVAHGLSPTQSNASADTDNDGVSDVQEYLLGRDPATAEPPESSVSSGPTTTTGTSPLVASTPAEVLATAAKIQAPSSAGGGCLFSF